MVHYHLQKVTGKSDGKVNGTILFESFQWKISGSNGMFEKGSRVFPVGTFQTEIHVSFLQSRL